MDTKQKVTLSEKLNVIRKVEPSLRHCLFVVEGLRALFEAGSYADGSIAAGRFYHVRQVKA
jgi:hypothetical protein